MRSPTFACGFLLCLAWACGDAKPPVQTPPTHPPAPMPNEPDGAATKADPYASFDAGAPAEPPVAAPSPPPDLGSTCQKAAVAWEKRARPAIKACYREGKKAEPNLMGTARILVTVASDGKPKPANLDGPSSLGDDVAKCMVEAVQKTPFPDAAECKARQLTIPVEFPSKPTLKLPTGTPAK